jgi:enoyl-CoA hydratase
VIDTTRRGDVAVLQITHGKANALDLELCEALTAELDGSARSDARALVVTGQGKMFSAGLDLVRLVDGDRGGAAYVRAFMPVFNRMFETLFAYPKPVVAAVNGHAIAGGCIMACAADYRMMAREPGRIGIPELLVGVPFPVVPLEIMRFSTPPHYLQAMAYRGATLTAEAALQHGIVDAVADPDRLLDDAVSVAEALAAMPSAAFALTKRQLRDPAMQRIRAGAAMDAEVTLAWASAETLTAIRDYVARTLKR